MENNPERERTRVLPPGPFPPSGLEPADVIDLGIRLRDTLYRRSVLLDARGALQSSIRSASRSPRQLLMSMPSIEAFIDTWPLASMIDDALASWREEPNPHALAVLHRTADVVGGVLGWPRSIDHHWPLPDEAWMRRQCDGEVQVVRRGPRDGSAAVAVALNAPFGPSQHIPFPDLIEIHGDEIASRISELVLDLTAGKGVAVHIDGWIPWDDESQMASEALRLTHPMQAAYSQYGLAALAAGGGIPFADLLETAPPGVMGESMRRIGDAVIIPGMNAEGEIHAVGVLCWDDRYTAVRVTPVAIAVLDAIGQHQDLDKVAKELQASRDDVEVFVKELVAVGAITSVDA